MTTVTAALHPIAERALRELDSQAIRTLVSEIGLPSAPRLLVKVHRELEREEPKLHRLTKAVSEEPGLAPAMLRSANSSLFALTKPVDSIEQAFQVLGLLNCQSLLSAIELRKLLPADGPAMDRYWNLAAKRTRAMTYIARSRRVVTPALAHMTGVFLDVGIPLLTRRYPGPDGYLRTLDEANHSLEPFTRVERRMHVLDHAVVGAITARSWGMPQTAVAAVRLHHEYAAWNGSLPQQVAELLGLSLVADRIVSRYEEIERDREWEKGGRLAMAVLGIDEPKFYEWCDEVHHHFDHISRENLLAE